MGYLRTALQSLRNITSRYPGADGDAVRAIIDQALAEKTESAKGVGALQAALEVIASLTMPGQVMDNAFEALLDGQAWCPADIYTHQGWDQSAFCFNYSNMPKYLEWDSQKNAQLVTFGAKLATHLIE